MLTQRAARFAGLGALLLSACGPAPAPAPADTATPAAPAAGPAPVSYVCDTIARIVASRADTPAFSSLPADLTLKDGVSCAPATRDIAVGPDRTPVSFSVFECVYHDRAGVREEAGWPIWTGVLEDASACFSGWQAGGQSEMTPAGIMRSLTFERSPDASRITRPEGQIEPVRFLWTQDGAQRIVFQVLAE